MRMSGRILQNREGGKCLREIIVDRGNGAKAFVLFELTKGNIAEIKDRYILEQLRSAIDSPWSTALPDGIRSALIRSVSEEMEDRFLLENMDKDTDMSVKSAIRSAAISLFHFRWATVVNRMQDDSSLSAHLYLLSIPTLFRTGAMPHP